PPRRARASEPPSPPDVPRDGRLRQPLAEAAPPEVPPRRPARGHGVANARRGLVEEHAVREAARRPDAELGLLAAEGARPDAAHVEAEAARRVEDLAAERHVGPDEVAQGSR